MKKIALTSLAVMAVVGVFAIQPVDAKKVEQDPVMTPIEMQQLAQVSQEAAKMVEGMNVGDI